MPPRRSWVFVHRIPLVLAIAGASACSSEEARGEPEPAEEATMAQASARARVQRFIEDWGAAWQQTRAIVDADPLGALDRWDAAIAEIDERHFVRGASSGSAGAFSRRQADHHPDTEQVVDDDMQGERVLVRTEAPHPRYTNRRIRYEYELVRADREWRIAQLREVEPP